jgi:hypothetical protein
VRAEIIAPFQSGAERSRERRMKAALLALLGLVLGAVAGGIAGFGAGYVWTEVIHSGDSHGVSTILMFFGFMPAGAITGAIVGAAWLGSIGMRRSQS